MTSAETAAPPTIDLDLGDDLDQFVDLPSGVRICFRDHPATGPSTDPGRDVPLLLVAGLSLDQTSWPTSMTDALRAAGFRVLTLDNRDAGRSTRFEGQASASKVAMLRAKAPQGAYTLEEMSEDVSGLLDHLDIDRVHLVGMSMGGMISQIIASSEPTRVATLTSIFSTTGHLKVGQPAKATLLRMAKPAPRNETEHVAGHLLMMQYLAGAGFPPDVEDEIAHALRNWRRGVGRRNGAGTLRQISAIQASGDRTPTLSAIAAPTLVIHGDKDPMVAPSGGLATHQAVAGSKHVVVPGMGHHISSRLGSELAGMVIAHVDAQG